MKYHEDSSIWTEKYRPRSVDDCILPEHIKTMAKNVVDNGVMPNMIFSGSQGTGKTTLARAMAHEMDMDVKFVNGSEEGRLLETLRNQIANHARNVSLSGRRKLVIIDEADYIPPDTVQSAMRAFVEQESDNCSFVFTCNEPMRIIKPLRSRCSQIDFGVPKNDRNRMLNETLRRIAKILKDEGVDYDKEPLKAVVLEYFPDIRRILSELQPYSYSGKIDNGILTKTHKTDIEKLVEMARKKEWKNVRYWVAEQDNLNMEQIVRQFYDNAYEFVKPDSIPDLVLILGERQYKHSFSADPEISVMAMMTEIMTEIEFQ